MGCVSFSGVSFFPERSFWIWWISSFLFGREAKSLWGSSTMNHQQEEQDRRNTFLFVILKHRSTFLDHFLFVQFCSLRLVFFWQEFSKHLFPTNQIKNWFENTFDVGGLGSGSFAIGSMYSISCICSCSGNSNDLSKEIGGGIEFTLGTKLNSMEIRMVIRS